MVEYQKNQDARGRFVPGNRAQSKRRGRRYQDACAYARACSIVAMEALLDVAANPCAKPKTRELAARTLLNYGWGKGPCDIAAQVEAASLLMTKSDVHRLFQRRTADELSELLTIVLLLRPDLPKAFELLHGGYKEKRTRDLLSRI